jgi:hypothetical protein
MRKVGLPFALILLCVASVCAQQEPAAPANSGDLNTSPAPPSPDKEGVYAIGPGITGPILARPAIAGPPEVVAACSPDLTLVSAVIAVDGTANVRNVYHSRNSKCEAAAISAVKESAFQPGLLNNHPIPVLVCIGVPFLNHIKSPAPEIQACPRDEGNEELRQCPASPPRDTESGENSARSSIEITPPKLQNQPEAEFPDESRRAIKKQHIKDFEAISVLSLIVDVNGMPQNLCLLRPAGYGLDPKAAEAVRRYRFDPARKDGKPVPVQITVEVDFKLY